MVSMLHAFYFIERAADELQANETGGHLSVDAVWPRIQDPPETTFYISGPPPMLKAISQDLRGRSIRAEAIRIDAWE